MVAGILRDYLDVHSFLLKEVEHLPHGRAEVDLITKQLEVARIQTTSSCGWVLDAISCILGICNERTYEGEPAMKLETAARGGKEPRFGCR
jgi:hydrogenase maturation protein HypF